jgi:hypothetical protein
MGLIELIIVIAIVGVLLWAVNNYLPMDAKVKKILNVVVIVVLIIWLLSVFLPLTGFHDIRIGR